MATSEREFTEFVHGAWTPLVRVATALTGDVHAAEDVQATLARVYLRWRRATIDSPYAYSRAALIRSYCSARRRAWRGELSTGEPIEAGTVPDHAVASGERAVVTAALAALPRDQRAVLVLRFLEDLSVDDTAAVLGCSPGTVRSRTNRALSRLRTSDAFRAEPGPAREGAPR